jgi:RNA recognition motif-containing protein
MNNNQEAQSAIEQLNGTTLGNRTITVNEARERPAGGGRGGRERRSYSNNYRSDRY